jgi:hypothetical protein
MDFTMTNKQRPTNATMTGDAGREASLTPAEKKPDPDAEVSSDDSALFERPASEDDDNWRFDSILMQSIQNDPCIHPENWFATYRAARDGKPEWWLAVADDPVEAEEPRDSSTREGMASQHEKEKRSGSEGEGKNDYPQIIRAESEPGRIEGQLQAPPESRGGIAHDAVGYRLGHHGGGVPPIGLGP